MIHKHGVIILRILARLLDLVHRRLNLVHRLNLVVIAGVIVVPSLAEERSQSKDLDEGANQGSFF